MYFECPIWTDNDVFRERDDYIKLKAWEEGNDLGYLRMAVRVFPTNNIGSSTMDFYSRLHEYYECVLSYNTDIIKAFSGVFHAFKEPASRKTSHFYGTPTFSSTPQAAPFVIGLWWRVIGNEL
jgi:hypothetical protein